MARLGLLRAMGGLKIIAPGPPIHIECEQCSWDGRFRSQRDAMDAFLKHRRLSHL